jgi:CBS domain-containing protein
MIARDIMTKQVHTVRPDAPVADIAKLLLDNGISAVPVVDGDDHVIGIVSEADLVRRHEIGTEKRRPWWLQLFEPSGTLASEYVRGHAAKAHEIMARPVFCVDETAAVGEVADVLEGHGVKRVPVVRAGKLVGIISRRDLVRAFATAAPSPAADRASDNRIRAELSARLKQQPWAQSLYVQSQVHDGVVDFWGFADSEEQRRGLTVLAETITGVKGVVNRLTVGMNVLGA